MSLLRLLTAGKSLVGLTDTESRYRLTSQRLLPQFGSPRNPFRRSGKSEPAPSDARSAGHDGGSDASSGSCGSANLPTTAPAALTKEVRPGAASANKGVRRFVEALRTWTAQLVCRCKEALAGLGGRLRFKAVKPAIPRLTKLPVQGELSLDRIRVVRNDLSDADLEVLAARPPTAPASPELALPTGKRAGVAAGRWAKVNARFFGAGRT